LAVITAKFINTVKFIILFAYGHSRDFLGGFGAFLGGFWPRQFQIDANQLQPTTGRGMKKTWPVSPRYVSETENWQAS
jgi:hypothetical protein